MTLIKMHDKDTGQIATLVYSCDDDLYSGRGYYFIRRDWYGSQLFETEDEAKEAMLDGNIEWTE